MYITFLCIVIPNITVLSAVASKRVYALEAHKYNYLIFTIDGSRRFELRSRIVVSIDNISIVSNAYFSLRVTLFL